MHSPYLKHFSGQMGVAYVSHEAESLLASVFNLSAQLLALRHMVGTHTVGAYSDVATNKSAHATDSPLSL